MPGYRDGIVTCSIMKFRCHYIHCWAGLARSPRSHRLGARILLVIRVTGRRAACGNIVAVSFRHPAERTGPPYGARPLLVCLRPPGCTGFSPVPIHDSSLCRRFIEHSQNPDTKLCRLPRCVAFPVTLARAHGAANPSMHSITI
jgi:hypothetical protein